MPRLSVAIFIPFISAILAFSQTEIVFKSGDSELAVAGFEGTRPFSIDKGRKQFFSANGIFSIKGTLETLSPYAYFSPLASRKIITRFGADESIITEYRNWVTLGSDYKGQNSWTIRTKQLLNNWGLPENTNHLFAVAWIDPDSDKHRLKLLQYTPLPEENGTRVYRRKTLSLNSSERLIPAIFLIDEEGKLMAFPKSNEIELFTQLALVLIHDDATTLSQIIKENPQLLKKSYSGFLPFHMAAAYGAVSCMHALLDAGANINEKTPLKHQAIHLAVGNSELSALEFLVHNKCNISSGDYEGDNPLHAAVYVNSPEMVKLLVEAGAKTNKKNKRGFTPAAIAVNEDDFVLFRYLYERGSKIPLTSRNKQIMLAKVIRKNDLDNLSFIVKKWPKVLSPSQGFHPLCSAAKISNSRFVQALLDYGLDPDEVDLNGYTPLMYASAGNLDAVRTLVEEGADPNLVNPKGGSALHVAILNQQLEITKFLLDNGANPNLKNPDGTPILWFATLMGNRQSLHELINAGATCAMTEDTAVPIMEYAFRYDIPEIVEITLTQCLRPDFNFYEDIPAYWVAKYYKSEAIMDLLELAGIDPETIVSPTIVSPKSLRDQVEITNRAMPVVPYEIEEKYGEFTARVQCIVDRDGQVILPRIISNPAPELRREILESMREWRFKPLMVDNQPVRSQFTIPLKFIPLPEEDRFFEIEQTEIKPVPKRQIEPVYPPSLKRTRVNGRVTIAFIVDKEGNVINPIAENASHPAFVQPAIDAISRWKFNPGYRGGEPVAVRIRAPLIFRVN